MHHMKDSLFIQVKKSNEINTGIQEIKVDIIHNGRTYCVVGERERIVLSYCPNCNLPRHMTKLRAKKQPLCRSCSLKLRFTLKQFKEKVNA